MALGRKDHLFAGSDAGGECAAAICSPIESAKRNGLDPEGCLHHVLGRIADHPVRRVDELLPWAIAGENLIRAAARPAAGSSRKNVGKTKKDDTPGAELAGVSYQWLRGEDLNL